MENKANESSFSLSGLQKPFIIAEMSGNHNQSLDRALAIVDAAADAGVDAIKLQTYTADTITVQGALTIDDPTSPWNKKELYELYQQAYTPWEWHAAIFARAKERGLIAFSSPFDETAVDFLEELGCPIYKIASFENTDWVLLKKVASTGKPVIMSTGATNLSEIDEAVRILRKHGCKDLALLKCTSTYPASPEDTNLLTIPHMSTMFHCQVGLSDHTMGVGVAIAAIALGAKVIEKHLTLSRAEGGVDSVFSMEPHEFKLLTQEAYKAFLALGNVQYGIQKAEGKSIDYKRSIYVTRDIKAGETLDANNIASKRPAFGLHTKHYEEVLGKKANKDIKKGTPLSWGMINQE